MTVVDVRSVAEESIDTIRFAEKSGFDYYPDIIKRDGQRVVLVETDMSRELALRDKNHASNLIKALEKAIELGWLK